MYRNDYILRLIAQFAEVIHYVLGLRRDGKLGLTLMAIDQALRDLLGIGSEQLKTLSDAQALALIRFASPDESWRSKGAYVAALLAHEGAVLAAREQGAASDQANLLALQIALEVHLGAGELALPGFTPDVTELSTALAGMALPTRTTAALLRYHEEAGNFAHAEDLLFAQLDLTGDDAALAATGVALFERLLACDDTALAAGNLPREEIVAALEELGRR